MRMRDKISFIIYILGSLLLLGFGLVYAFCPTIMPYHQEAIKTDWEHLSPGLQILLQGFIKLVAAGMFVTGVMGIILLFIPFKRGESWARWALALCGLLWNIPGLYVSSTIALKTHASTPWKYNLVGMIMIIVAFILSPPYNKAT
jgi:ABC-type Fe3+ transport system permease subunit